MSDDRPAPYVHALRFPALTRFYDRLLAATMREANFKRRLVAQAGLASGQRVLDLGCGTGTLTMMAKQACPDAELVGLDGDDAVLAIARSKADAAGAEVELVKGLAWSPPFPPASFDRVISSLVFHHLTTADKRRTFAAITRLLRPGGELHVADWGRPQNLAMRAAFTVVRALDGFAITRDNAQGRLPALMRDAGFDDVSTTDEMTTIFGTLALYRARRAWHDAACGRASARSRSPPRSPATWSACASRSSAVSAPPVTRCSRMAGTRPIPRRRASRPRTPATGSSGARAATSATGTTASTAA